MNELERIFKTTDKERRIEALIDFARKLKVDLAHASDHDGIISENRLAVLIHDALSKKDKLKKQRVALVVGAIFLLGMGIACIFIFLVLANMGK